jgi:hypothetical protein
MARTIDGIERGFPVIRVLRCRMTHRYFTGDGWCENPEHAETFPDQIGAARACASHKLENIELVLRVEGSQTDLFCTPMR